MQYACEPILSVKVQSCTSDAGLPSNVTTAAAGRGAKTAGGKSTSPQCDKSMVDGACTMPVNIIRGSAARGLLLRSTELSVMPANACSDTNVNSHARRSKWDPPNAAQDSNWLPLARHGEQ